MCDTTSSADKKSDTLRECEIRSLSLSHSMMKTRVVQYCCTVSNGLGYMYKVSVIQPDTERYTWSIRTWQIIITK